MTLLEAGTDILVWTSIDFVSGPGEESGLKRGAIPGLPTPLLFGTAQKCARQRHGCETSGNSFAVSLPHTLLFKMKGNTVSQSGRCCWEAGSIWDGAWWQRKAEAGMSLIFFSLSADFKLSIQTPALAKVRRQPLSAAALYEHGLVHGLTSGCLIPISVQALPWCKDKSLPQ